MDEETRSIIKSTREEWKKIGDTGRKIHSQNTTEIHS